MMSPTTLAESSTTINVNASVKPRAKDDAATASGEKELPAPNIHGETIEYRLSYKHFIPMRWTNTFNPDVKRYTQRNIRDWLAEEPAPMSDKEWQAMKARLKRGRSMVSRGRSFVSKKGGGRGGGGRKSTSPKSAKSKSPSPAKGGKGGGGGRKSTTTAKSAKSKSSSPAKGGKGGRVSAVSGAKGGKGGRVSAATGRGKAAEPIPEPEEELPKLPSVLILDQSIFPQPKNVLKKGLVRTYDDGSRWLSMFDDGSGSIFHPEGGVAINIIPWQRLGRDGEEIAKPRLWDNQRNSFIYDEYADQFLFTAHSHKKGGELVGLFLPTGRTSWYYQTPKDTCHFEPTKKHATDPNQPVRCRRRRLRLVTDKLMGVQLNVNGDIGNTWKWFDQLPPASRNIIQGDGEEEDGGEPGGGVESGSGDVGVGTTAAAAAAALPVAPPSTPVMATLSPTAAKPAPTGVAATSNPASGSRPTATSGASAASKKAPPQSTALLAEVVTGMIVDADGNPTRDLDGADVDDGVEMGADDADEPETELVPAPAIGVIAGKIDRNIGVKIVSQEKMFLSFQAKNKLVSFNVGSKITLLTQESVLDSTCKNYKQELRNFRRLTRSLMRKMIDTIPQVELDLKLAGKL